MNSDAHKCDTKDCPYFGQPSPDNSCKCHKTKEQMLRAQLERANRLIGWLMPYIGSMCPPDNGLYELNQHCFENHVPTPGDETKGAPIGQPRLISSRD